MSEAWCWEDGRDHGLFGTTCTLPDGHPGEHEFTPDDQIIIEFK